MALGRASRARVGAIEGAAVRDADGRTYAGATVELRAMPLSALQVAVALAVSAGAAELAAAAVVTEASTVDSAGYAAFRELGPGAPVHLAAPDGTLLDTVTR